MSTATLDPIDLERDLGTDADGPLARLRWALRDGWLVAERDVAQWIREPQLIVWGLIYPVISVLLFAYVFGSGIIVPGGGSYREFLMPGIFAQTMAFGIGETLAAVQADSSKGVTDRFRSMPMAPSAVVVGRCVSGMLYSAASLTLVVVCGLAVGWRWHGSPVETAGAFGLLLLLRMAFLWVGIIFGLRAESPEMANSIFGLLYPVTMLSSAFIDPSPQSMRSRRAGLTGGVGRRARLRAVPVDTSHDGGSADTPRPMGGRRGPGGGPPGPPVRSGAGDGWCGGTGPTPTRRR